jgi:hypothetical protein
MYYYLTDRYLDIIPKRDGFYIRYLDDNSVGLCIHYSGGGGLIRMGVSVK